MIGNLLNTTKDREELLNDIVKINEIDINTLIHTICRKVPEKYVFRIIAKIQRMNLK